MRVKQLVNKPRHLLADLLSCIDLIITSQPNLEMKTGVYSSLHPNYHHEITYSKLNPQIHYQNWYEWKIGHYRKAYVYHIKKAWEFPWERKFQNNGMNEKINIVNTTIIDPRKKIKNTNPIFRAINNSFSSLTNFSFFKQS